MKNKLIPPILMRRLSFLMEEAKQNAKRDQVTTYAMRVISNYATIGRDASSTKVKSENKNVSEAAYNLLLELNSLEKWAKQTINEHQIPLKVLYEEIQSRDLDEKEIWEIFLDAPMITITKKEDAKLNSIGLKSSSDKSRYKKADINIIELPDLPKNILKNKGTN